MEYADSGNLKDYLGGVASALSSPSPNTRHVTVNSLMHYSWQISRGMTYIALKRVRSTPICFCVCAP